MRATRGTRVASRRVVLGVAGAGLAAALAGGLVGACGVMDAGGRTMVRALPADAGFTHPGVLVNARQLDVVRENVTAGRQPWLKAYLDMRDSPYGSYRHRARPVRTVHCPGGRAGRGCAAERKDAIAAYTQALLYGVTGKRQHAEKAIEIMDAWSERLRRHTGGDAALQAAWTGGTWARAAEIVRHAPGAGWEAGYMRRFEGMLRTVHLPEVTRPGRADDGHRELVAADAALGMAVFLDDHRAFDAALRRFREHVPAQFPLERGRSAARTDCRHLRRTGASLAAAAHIAETAWHQGVDVYSEVEDRLRATLDRQAAGLRRCGGTAGPPPAVVLNHLEQRLDKPAAAARSAAARPGALAGTDHRFVAWESLTHTGNPGG
ncbi:alginate lyase family protein [Streptomyces sp. NPDC006610]|uniref:alginate lyase family protein n=1 Tax=Streptomyces sp. NPDC006610 TaxID=3154584 RepID=UPI00339E99E6